MNSPVLEGGAQNSVKLQTNLYKRLMPSSDISLWMSTSCQKELPRKRCAILSRLRDDTRPLVLTLTLSRSYKSVSFASLLTAFATAPNFRGVAILGESGRLVAYSSVRQISWLASDYCSSSRQTLLKDILNKNEAGVINHISMSDIAASDGSSYADVLRKAFKENLTCIAIVDEHYTLCGIVDRDRLTAALVLSLTSSVQRKVGAGRAEENDKPAVI